MSSFITNQFSLVYLEEAIHRMYQVQLFLRSASNTKWKLLSQNNDNEQKM